MHCPKIICQWSCLPLYQHLLSHMKSVHNLPTIPLKCTTNISVSHLLIGFCEKSHTSICYKWQKPKSTGPNIHQYPSPSFWETNAFSKIFSRALVVSNTILAITGT
jgi:hypothetical protein